MAPNLKALSLGEAVAALGRRVRGHVPRQIANIASEVPVAMFSTGMRRARSSAGEGRGVLLA